MEESKMKDYSVVIEQPVAWGEMDALGHVNNSVYFRYFETVRISYFQRLGLLEMFDLRQVGPVLSETSCQFRRPVKFPDRLLLGARVDEISSCGFSMSYCALSLSTDKLTTQGSAVIVLYDFIENKKCSVPDVLVKKIETLESKRLSI